MKQNHFVIIADGLDPLSDVTYDAFYEAGCADAEISWCDGVFTMAFRREADRFADALIGAYRDVIKAGANVKRFEPDSLVTLSEISERAGVAADKIAELRGSHDLDFPGPSVRVGTDEPLWDWSDVAIWLQRRQLVGRDIAIQARAIWEANTTLLLQATQGVDFERALGGLDAAAN